MADPQDTATPGAPSVAPATATDTSPAPAPAVAAAAPAPADAPALPSSTSAAPAPAASPEAAASPPAATTDATSNGEPPKTTEAAKPAEAAPADGTDRPKSPLETHEAKQAEADKAKPPEGEKPKAEEAKAAVEPVAPEPIKYDFEWTDHVKDGPHTAEFSDILNEARVPAEAAQKLVGLADKVLTDFAGEMAKEQHRVFNRLLGEEGVKVMADEVIGGAGHETAMAQVARARDFLLPADLRAEFDHFLQATGAGHHRVFLRMMHNAGQYIDEPQAANLPTEIRPAINGNTGADRRAILYSNTTFKK